MAFDWKSGELKPESAIVPTRLRPGRFPLLWILVPLVVAYAAAETGWAPAPGWLQLAAVTGVGVATAAAWRGWCAERAARRAGFAAPAAYDRRWAVGLTVAVLALGVLWQRECCPPPPDRAGLPPREAVLSVGVDALFETTSGALSGLGTVVAAPEHLAELTGARIQFKLTLPKGMAAPAELDLGARVRLRGVLAAAPEGEGFARYLRQRGVAFTLARARPEAVEVPASAFRMACTRARGRVAEALSRGVGREDAARLGALMLGRTGLLSREERDDFRRAGATHIFAISGLHITGIAAGLLWATRRLRLRDAVAMPLILTGLWLYVQMAGAPPSAMRAWIMAAGLAAAVAAGRGARPLAGLVGAALLTLVLDPAALRDPGFLLSYTVVAALLVYAGPLTECIDTVWRPWRYIPPDALGWGRRQVLACKRAVITALVATSAATLAGLPLVASLFGQVSPVGLVANLALIPLSAPPVILGFGSSVLGAVGWGDRAGPLNAVGAMFMRASAWCAHLAARIPGGAVAVESAPGWAVGFAGVAVTLALLVYPPQPDGPRWRYAALPAAVLVYFMTMMLV